MNKPKKGFTLVELLIVIVVIAILAAISIVSYSGIKDRAYNASVESAASNALKIIQLAYTSEGRILLNGGGGIPGGGYAMCIGDPADFPETSNFAAGQCHTNGSGAWASQELWDAYSNYASGNLAVGEMYDGSSTYARGIIYAYLQSTSTGDHSDYLSYGLIGDDQECSLPGAEPVDDIDGFSDGPDKTSCWINLDKLIGEAPLNW